MNHATTDPSHEDDAARTQTAAGVVKRLQGMLDQALADHLPALRRSGCALIDHPDHGNVGDSAIWAGQVAFLDRHGVTQHVVGDCTMDLEEIRALPPDVPILLLGGGNFGDLWPVHQLFRESVITQFPDRLVIQLPQSIHYDDPALIERTAAVIAQHPRFVLMVRDRPSLELARQRFRCDVRLCPDMAFALGPLPRPVAPDHEVVMLMRTDSEQRGDMAGGEEALPANWMRADWLEDEDDLYPQVLRMTRVGAALSLNPRRMGRMARRRAYCNNLAGRRIARGLHLLARGRYVITDRLHVHILCTLMAIPHCVLDNRYGKIAGLSDAFGTRWDGVDRATTLPEAMSLARDALTRSRMDRRAG